MPIFTQSAFLQALGYAITNSLWQAAFAWLVFMMVNSLFSLSAAAKYRFAVAAQVSGFIWFMVTLQFYYTQAPLSPGSPVAGLSGTATGSISAQLINWLVKAEQGLPYLSMAYLLLMGFLATRWILGYRHTQTMRTGGLQKMPVDWRLFVKKVAAQLGIKKEIGLFLSEQVTTPLTIGFLKPVIMLPVASINHLTTEQLEAVLLHELAHIKRYDYLVNMVISVMELALFFNPFTQLLGRVIQKERENSCDDWVLQFQYNASEYAEALLRIAYLQQAPTFAMAASGKKNELLTRVKRVMGKQENRFNYRRQLLALLLVTILLSSVAWLSPVSTGIYPATTTVSLKKIKVPELAVENPLFNPGYFLSDPMKEVMKKDRERTKKEVADQEIADVVLEAKPELKKAKQEMEKALEQTSEVMMAEDGIKLEINNAFDEIKKLDLEKIISGALRLSDLSEAEKEQLRTLKGLRLSGKDKELLRKELKEKQMLRNAHPKIQTEAAMIEAPEPVLIMSKALHPISVINEEDDKQVIKIKLAVLQQLKLLLAGNIMSIAPPKREKEKEDVVILEQ